MSDLYKAAQQALEAMNYTGMDVGKFNRINAASAALRAALAQQAEPSVLWYLSGDGYAPVTFEQSHPPEPLTVDEALAHGWRRFYSAPPAQQAEPVTVKDLQQMLVDADLVDPHAIDDPDGYDGGFTLAQINELHARLTEGQR